MVKCPNRGQNSYLFRLQYIISKHLNIPAHTCKCEHVHVAFSMPDPKSPLPFFRGMSDTFPETKHKSGEQNQSRGSQEGIKWLVIWQPINKKK